MKIWKLKKGADQRLRSRHPWVFSNELMESPKGIQAGELIEIHDYKNHFLARGYGNPHSLISFRALTFESKDFEIGSIDFMAHKLVHAWSKRNRLGFTDSFRLCFSEADSLPGLILDRYVFENNGHLYQVFSYQLLTAGMQKIFENTTAVFEKFVQLAVEKKLSDIDWGHTILLERNDVNVRKLEGLNSEEPRVVYNPSQQDLTQVKIRIPSVVKSLVKNPYLYFSVNLIEGQKTGFFLDQTHNMKLVIEALQPWALPQNYSKENPLRILDLCCYMGQWSAQIAHFLKDKNIPFEITLVDVSELALQKAKENLSVYTPKIHVHKMDVLKDLPQLAANTYDVVISDPPAFVKNKKDMETGLHGYMKLNEQAFRLAKKHALVASCTCSGLVQMVDFKNSLRKAIVRSGQSAVLITEGGLGWDHPSLVQFPEGQYLKMLLHYVN